MGKGWTRRPSAVDRAAFDARYADTFGPVVEENGIGSPAGDTVIVLSDEGKWIKAVSLLPRKRPALDACDIADVMEGDYPVWREA